MSVMYSAQGVVTETETIIGINDLPVVAKQYASARGKIKEASMIVKANGETQYEAEVGKKDLMFNDKGIFISEKNKSAEKD